MSDFVKVNAIDQPLKAIFLESLAWTRLEPQAISGDPEPGLEARVHDPLWLLARQWQLAEFEGEDVGTPLIVHVKTTELPITAWQPGDPASDRPARPIDSGVPLDPLVENEPPVNDPGLRQRAEAGAYLVELLADEGFDARKALLKACPLPVGNGPEPVSPNFQLIARQTPDGLAAAEQLEAGAPPWLSGGNAKARGAAARWLDWFRANVAPPARERADDSWIPERFEYHFSVRAGSGENQRVLHAPLHEGGEIDWYTFDVDREAQLFLEEENAAVQENELNVMATPLRFAGMPADRYWQFEDGQVNLGRLDAQPHDLARLCVAEFGMIYGNDWLVVPLNVAAASLTTVIEVAYTDTFGERTSIPRAEDANLAGSFCMFEMSVRGAGEYGGARTLGGAHRARNPRRPRARRGALAPRRNGEHGLGRGARRARPERRSAFPRRRKASGQPSGGDVGQDGAPIPPADANPATLDSAGPHRHGNWHDRLAQRHNGRGRPLVRRAACPEAVNRSRRRNSPRRVAGAAGPGIGAGHHRPISPLDHSSRSHRAR